MRFSSMKKCSEIHNEHGGDPDYLTKYAPQVIDIIKEDFNDPEVEWNEWSFDFVATVVPIDGTVVLDNKEFFLKLHEKAEKCGVGSFRGAMRFATIKMLADGCIPVEESDLFNRIVEDVTNEEPE